MTGKEGWGPSLSQKEDLPPPAPQSDLRGRSSRATEHRSHGPAWSRNHRGLHGLLGLPARRLLPCVW